MHYGVLVVARIDCGYIVDDIWPDINVAEPHYREFCPTTDVVFT